MLIFNMSRVENIIWNNKEIKIYNKPFFIQVITVWVLFLYAISYLNRKMSPLTSALNTKDSILLNFLTWTPLRTSVPKSLRARVLRDEFDPMICYKMVIRVLISSLPKGNNFINFYQPKS